MIDTEMLVLLLPLIILELVLKVLCFRDWLKRSQFNGLPRTGWLLVFLFVNFFGPIAYLVYGRKMHGDH